MSQFTYLLRYHLFLTLSQDLSQATVKHNIELETRINGLFLSHEPG